MLGSISPVGEAARGQRWWLTTTTYIAASIAGGALVGAALGALGAAIAQLVALDLVTRLAVLAAVALLGAASDAGLLWRWPTWRRQVNEAWLTEYRGWVYGVGFGFQLGSGFATIIPAAVTYTAFAACLLAMSLPGGVAVGVAFGLVRSLPVLLTARLHTAAQLYETTRRVEAAEPVAGRLVVAGQVVVAAVAAATIVVI